MSDSDSSDSGAGSQSSGHRHSMQRASASPNYVAPSFAALRTLPMQRIVEDENWHNNGPQDFHQQFHTGRHYLPGEPRTKPAAPASSTGSMAVAINQSQYSASLYSGTPSLTGSYGTTASSRPSVGTSSGASILSQYQAPGRLVEGDDGVAQVPTSTNWQCPYGFLRCNESLEDIREWDAHCQAHFRGSLPKNVQCPFECHWSFQGSSGQEAWMQRWAHVWTHHSSGGKIDVFRRPDSYLVEHLWRIGVINPAQVKELRTNGFLSGDAYMESASGSRDRRRERRPGGGRYPQASGSAGGYQPVVRH